MRLTFTTPWSCQGLTTMAVTFGRLLQRMGHTVTYRAWPKRLGGVERLGAPEDDRLIPSIPPSDWAVWFEVMETDLAARVREAGTRIAYIPMWESLVPRYINALPLYDRVLCPTRCCYEAVCNLGVTNAFYLPWFHAVEARPHPPRRREPTMLVDVRWKPGRLPLVDAIHQAMKGPHPFNVTLASSDPRIWTHADAAALRDALKALTRDFPRRVRIEGRRRDWTDMPDQYRDADLLWHVTPWEGLGLRVQEAMAHGVPVIGSDMPPVNEVVTRRSGYPVAGRFEGERGVAPVFRPDPDAAVEAIQRAVHPAGRPAESPYRAWWKRRAPFLRGIRDLAAKAETAPKAWRHGKPGMLTFVLVANSWTAGATPESTQQWPTERLIAAALKRAGHTVHTIEPGADLPVQPDVVMAFHWYPALKQWEQWRRSVPVLFGMTFDLLWRDPGKPLAEQTRLRRKGAHMRLCDTFFCREPDHFPDLARLGIRAKYLDQAAAVEYADGNAEPNPDWACDFAFCGTPYEPGGRLRILRELQEHGTVGIFSPIERHAQWRALGFDPKPPVYGRHLARLAKSAPVWLGANYRNDVRMYWSNRMWLALNAGAFFVGHRVEGLDSVVTPGRHLMWYDTVEGAVGTAVNYLHRPEKRVPIARQGHQYAMKHHTYDHRVVDIVTEARRVLKAKRA